MGDCGMASHTPTTDPPNDSPPREWGAYLTTNHATMRFELCDRPVTKALARRAVENGTPEPNDAVDADAAWRFRLPVDGCDIVVAAVEEQYAHRQSEAHDAVILTAYVDVRDATEAFGSDTWEFDDVHRAAALQYLGGDRLLPDDLSVREVHVDGRLLVKGHTVVFTHGHDTAVCSKCGVKASGKGRFGREPCQ